MTREQVRHLRNGLLFASPWLVGLTLFMAYPIVSSIYLSFCDYSTLQPPIWVGLQNYRELFQDSLFYKSLANTLVFGVLTLPAGLVTALFLALLLNSGVRGMAFYRAIFYMPCLVPAVASAMLWMWVFNGDAGILNYGLSFLLEPIEFVVNGLARYIVGLLTGDLFNNVGTALGGRSTLLSEVSFFTLSPPTWLGDPNWAKPALAIMSIWGIGGTMVIYLAGLQDVPEELYEAAEIDGAGWWRKLFHVTLPALSPVIYFTLIMGLIAVLQIFTPAYIMGGGPQGGTAGNPAQSTLFYALYLWAQAFEYLKMGYGCAMAWILFMIIVVLTLIAHKLAGRSVLTAT